MSTIMCGLVIKPFPESCAKLHGCFADCI